MKISIGQAEHDELFLDVEKLLRTRMLVEAASGQETIT